MPGPHDKDPVVINFFDSLDAVKRFAGLTTRLPYSSRKPGGCRGALSR